MVVRALAENPCMAARCASMAAAIESVTAESWSIASATSASDPTTCRVRDWISAILPPICSVDRAVSVASDFTSEATTAKPRPAAPALAASMVALSASRLVWSAIELMTPTISPMWSAAVARALMISRELSARCTASRLAIDPRPTCWSIAVMAAMICSENLVLSWLMARELSAARAVSSDAARTVSSALRMSSAFARSPTDPSRIERMPISVALSSSLAMFDRLVRRAVRRLRPTSISTRSRRCCSRSTSARRSMPAIRRSISLRRSPLGCGAEPSSARTMASTVSPACAIGSDSERAARPAAATASAMAARASIGAPSAASAPLSGHGR